MPVFPSLLGLLGLLLALPDGGPGPFHPGTASVGGHVRGGTGGLIPALYLGHPRLLVERRSPGRVRLHWSAVPETDTQGYRVERSTDADHWLRRDFVPVSRNHRYAYDDTTATAYYYRVVRLDFSRHLSASPPVRSTYGTALGPLRALPNPARGPVRLLGRDPGLSVDVFNGRGELVHQIFTPFFTTEGLEPGVYALRQGRQIARLVVR